MAVSESSDRYSMRTIPTAGPGRAFRFEIPEKVSTDLFDLDLGFLSTLSEDISDSPFTNRGAYGYHDWRVPDD